MWPIIWTTWNPLYPRMLCAKFGWNWPSGSGKDHFLKTFHHFVIISPWKRTGPFIWTDLVLNMQVCFVRNFVEIGPVVLEKKINVFSLFCNYLPLEKGRALHLCSSPKNALCQVWLKLVQWFWRRWKCEKFMPTTTDRQQTNFVQKSSLESFALVSLKAI